jgi:hypothetical protein
LSLINLCGLHRLIWNNILRTCIKPCFPRLRLIIAPKDGTKSQQMIITRLIFYCLFSILNWHCRYRTSVLCMIKVLWYPPVCLYLFNVLFCFHNYGSPSSRLISSIKLAMGTRGLIHVHEESFQISLYSQHQQIRDYTFRLNWMFVRKRHTLNEKFHKSGKCKSLCSLHRLIWGDLTHMH